MRHVKRQGGPGTSVRVGKRREGEGRKVDKREEGRERANTRHMPRLEHITHGVS